MEEKDEHSPVKNVVLYRMNQSGAVRNAMNGILFYNYEEADIL